MCIRPDKLRCVLKFEFFPHKGIFIIHHVSRSDPKQKFSLTFCDYNTKGLLLTYIYILAIENIEAPFISHSSITKKIIRHHASWKSQRRTICRAGRHQHRCNATSRCSSCERTTLLLTGETVLL